MDKHTLSERDICTKFITPALRQAGWDEMLQIREEFGFTKGRIIVRGKLVTRGKAKRADYVLYFNSRCSAAEAVTLHHYRLPQNDHCKARHNMSDAKLPSYATHSAMTPRSPISISATPVSPIHGASRQN
jgi:hypothetical protein